MSTVTPCLWFDGNAEEAVAFYTSVVPNSRVTATMARACLTRKAAS